MSDSDHGAAYGENSTDPVDAWSRAVFEACRGWPLAASGRWFRVEDGWLRLRIEQPNGEPLEPLFAIDLDTPDGGILLDFGSWATPISPSGGPLDLAAEQALAEAREVVEDWLRGEVKLACYSDAAGGRTSKVIRGDTLPAAIEPVPGQLGEPDRVIVKTPRRSEWRSWRHVGNGLWIECEISEG